MGIETQNPSQSQPSRPTYKGSQSPIPSEPAPRLRPWMSSTRRDPGGNSINLTRNGKIESCLAKLYFGRVKQNLS